MRRTTCWITLGAVFLIGGSGTWLVLHFVTMPPTTSVTEMRVHVSAITPPHGWYSWGVVQTPADPRSTPDGVIATFANEPKSTHNSSAATITVSGGSLSGETPTQWIASRTYRIDRSLQAATSTMLWTVERGRVVVSAVTKTPAGGFVLSYQLFSRGAVYTFMLTPSPFPGGAAPLTAESLVNSPNATALRAMLAQFAKTLPPAA